MAGIIVLIICIVIAIIVCIPCFKLLKRIGDYRDDVFLIKGIATTAKVAYYEGVEGKDGLVNHHLAMCELLDENGNFIYKYVSLSGVLEKEYPRTLEK